MLACLDMNSVLIYPYAQVQEKKWKPEDAPLVQLTSNHFVISDIESDCSMKDFCIKKNLKIRNYNVFLESSSVDKSKIPHGIRDVILMDKVSPTYQYTPYTFYYSIV